MAKRGYTDVSIGEWTSLVCICFVAFRTKLSDPDAETETKRLHRRIFLGT